MGGAPGTIFTGGVITLGGVGENIGGLIGGIHSILEAPFMFTHISVLINRKITFNVMLT